MAETSLDRVRAAARDLELPIEIRVLDASTRTAAEAAAACGCEVGQIVKSLIFEGTESHVLNLLLVSGRSRVDEERARVAVGELLRRADPQRVREQTGFAIGGVAPMGHLHALPVWIDEALLAYETVWAAAGAPNAVFEVAPRLLADKIGAISVKLTAV